MPIANAHSSSKKKRSVKSPLNPMRWLEAETRRSGRQDAFVAADAKSARAWQQRVRLKLAKLLGFLDQAKTPLRPKVLCEVDRGSYVRRTVLLHTNADTLMPLYVLLPKQNKPAPVVLALHGHGYGAKDIVGLWEDGSERFKPEGYHDDFGCALAERGFVVAAPEISGFGQRLGEYSHLPADSPKPYTCHNMATYAMMLGGSALGMRAWDAIRALDYMETIKQADMSRVGAMGISGGGMHAMFSTALDLRIKACVISGYFCDFAYSTLNMHHCTCNFVPGLLKLGELSDIAGLIAPRPCLVEAGMRDNLFPFKHVQATVEKARNAWKAFGAAEQLQTDFFDGPHRINGEKAYAYLEKKLMHY